MTERAAKIDLRPSGLRLKRAVHVARERMGITTDKELAARAGVSYDTFMHWFGGKNVPRNAELGRLATFLGLARDDLVAVYEGRTVIDADDESYVAAMLRNLRDDLDRLRSQVDESTETILRAVAAVSDPDPAPRGRPGNSGHEAPSGTGR